MIVTPPTEPPLSSPTTSLQTYLESLRPHPLYLIFVASNDLTTNAPWCPDVRAAVPIIDRVFEQAEEELMAVRVKVGSKAAWRSADNSYRREWGVTAIPTVAKYSLMEIDGETIVAVRMLVEGECMDEEKLRGLISDSSVYE